MTIVPSIQVCLCIITSGQLQANLFLSYEQSGLCMYCSLICDCSFLLALSQSGCLLPISLSVHVLQLGLFILIISNKHICGLKAVHILVAVVALLCYPIVKSSNWSGGVLFISRSVHLLYPICMYLVYVLVCSKIVLYFVFGLYYFYIIPCAFVSTNHYKNYCLVDIVVFMIFYVDTCVDMSLEVSCSLAGPCIYCSIYSRPVCMFFAYIRV